MSAFDVRKIFSASVCAFASGSHSLGNCAEDDTVTPGAVSRLPAPPTQTKRFTPAAGSASSRIEAYFGIRPASASRRPDRLATAASTPVSAARYEAGSATLPATTFTFGLWMFARAGSRTMATTSWPRLSASSSMPWPTWPPAPNRAIFMDVLAGWEDVNSMRPRACRYNRCEWNAVSAQTGFASSMTENKVRTARVAVIGGGPAGLMAAETARAVGATVDVYERMGSVGRKFLIAGKGGLNLTHSDPFERFVSRYRGREREMRAWLEKFDADALREWARGLGVETFVGTSGRVFPSDLKAAPLLRGWVRWPRRRGP